MSDIFAIHQFWKDNSNFKMTTPRRTSCVLYFLGCSAIYKFNEDEELTVPRGSVLYIPEGAIYETKFFNSDNTLPATILIEFSLKLPDGDHFCAAEHPCILKTKNNAHISNLFYDVVENYSLSVIPLSKIKSIVYQLLSELSHVERQQSINSRGFYTIAQGIAYLESNFKSEKN